MTDMSATLPAAAPATPDAAAIEASYLHALQDIVNVLSDGTDHPEVWAVLSDVAEGEGVATLLRVIRDLRAGQFDPRVGKAMDIVAALAIGLSGNRALGLEMLRETEVRDPHCPQIAGAYFFLDRAHDPLRSPDLSDRFCSAPFEKFETLLDGSVAPCCSIWTQHRLGNLDGQSADQIWNSAAAQEMRESILDGSYRHCHKQRCTLITDDTLPKKAEVADPRLRRIIDENLTVVERPKWLFLAHDAACNLACPSCRDGLMGADEAQQARFAKIEEQVFRPILAGEEKVTISLSGQGDPWSSPHYRSILRHLADSDLAIDLNIHTNAMLMSEARWRQYGGLAKYRPLVDVSIDAVSPWVYEVLRRPGRWDRLEPNLRFLGRERAAGTFRAFHLNATIQLDNFHEMPAMIDYADAVGADTFRLYMMQNTGGHIARWYKSKNVGDPAHPLHAAFLETLRDPRLGSARAHLYDVAQWRSEALAATLPTDALGRNYTLDDLLAAVADAIRAGDFARVVALTAGGRTRFRDDADLLRIEARALERMKAPKVAAYRLREAEALMTRTALAA
jgi:hypothetical protein